MRVRSVLLFVELVVAAQVTLNQLHINPCVAQHVAGVTPNSLCVFGERGYPFVGADFGWVGLVGCAEEVPVWVCRRSADQLVPVHRNLVRCAGSHRLVESSSKDFGAYVLADLTFFDGFVEVIIRFALLSTSHFSLPTRSLAL